MDVKSFSGSGFKPPQALTSGPPLPSPSFPDSMRTATPLWAALLLFCVASPAAFAQAQPLGDEFIFFVDGTNVLVPNVESGSTVNDPLVAGNKVVKFNEGGWAESGFAWSRTEGVDATSFVGETYGESDTLFFRILSDPTTRARRSRSCSTT